MKYLFHLVNNKQEPLILLPDLDLEDGGESVLAEIKGLYGKDPETKFINEIRNSLYAKVDKSINAKLSDKYLLPRVMINLTVFVGVYIFLSVIIPDPIPQLDEIAFAAGSAFAVNWYVKKRQLQGTNFKQIEAQAKEYLDKIRFEPHEFLIRLEQLLEELEKAKKNHKDFVLRLESFLDMIHDLPGDILNQLMTALAQHDKIEKKSSSIQIINDEKELTIPIKQLKSKNAKNELVILYAILQKTANLIKAS
jgi:hypothetical protein